MNYDGYAVKYANFCRYVFPFSLYSQNKKAAQFTTYLQKFAYSCVPNKRAGPNKRAVDCPLSKGKQAATPKIKRPNGKNTKSQKILISFEL